MFKYDVSVVLVSYNHQDYIKEALDSILMQKVNFKYEIIFADDCSTDDTQKVIRELTKNIKDKQLLFSKENKGNTYNTLNAYSKCRGKYIIVLEGDDYWYSENKLQTQYDFLEKNKDYIAVSDKRCEVNKDKQIITSFPEWVKEDCDVTLNDILNNRPFSGVETMFRNIYETDFNNDRFKKLFLIDRMIGDSTLCIYLAHIGKVRVINQNMGVYRTITSGNITNYNSTSDVFKKAKDHVRIFNAIEEFYKYEFNMSKLYSEWLFQVFSLSILKFDMKEFNNLKKQVNKKYVRDFYVRLPLTFVRYIKLLTKKIIKSVRS